MRDCASAILPIRQVTENTLIRAIEKQQTEANVTEWSKVLRSGRSVFARVGSSPTVCIFPFLSEMGEYILNKQEVLYYDAVFASVVTGDEEIIRGKEAVTFLRRSGLSSAEIKSVSCGLSL